MARQLESSSTQAPGAYDILCSKTSKTLSKHQGNQIFRKVVLSFLDDYARASSKAHKMDITKEIVRLLHAQYDARFVKLHKGQWQEISDQLARDKVSHALRFAAKAALKAAEGRANTTPRGPYPAANETHSIYSPSDSPVQSSANSVSTSPSSPSMSLSTHIHHHHHACRDHDSSMGGDEKRVASVPLLICHPLILKALQLDDLPSDDDKTCSQTPKKQGSQVFH